MQTLVAGGVDIWLTNIADLDDALRFAYQALLTVEERTRCNRITASDARDQFLVARALVRTALSHYTNLPHQAWVFGVNAHGKPHILEPHRFTKLTFNLSHTKGLVACAVGYGRALGVDVECIHGETDYHRLPAKIFTQREQIEFNQATREQQHERFYTSWTLKEAYIKARGMGLTIPLNAFGFTCNEEVANIHFSARCQDMPENWTFFQMRPTPHHRLALAAAVDADRTLMVNTKWVVPLNLSKRSILDNVIQMCA